MSRIYLSYRPNDEYYARGTMSHFHGDYTISIERMKAFIETDDCNYSKDECEAILRMVETGKFHELCLHDKYTLHDTDWEREQVIALPDDDSPIIGDVEVYLNA